MRVGWSLVIAVNCLLLTSNVGDEVLGVVTAMLGTCDDDALCCCTPVVICF